MNGMEFTKYLNEYFSYIKTVFLREYSKYLSVENYNRIKDMTDVFRVDYTSKYKIFTTDKIHVCLNIKDFIVENNLDNDRDLKDISIDGKIFVKYLIDNQNNPEKVILSTIITEILKYFIKPNNDAIKIGTIDMITENLVNKYNLKNVKAYASKEISITNHMMDIVSRDTLLKSILNNDIKLIKEKYDNYIDESLELMDFDSLMIELDKEYGNYYRRIGRVYYSDSLYDYENINYSKILNELKKISNYHNNDINSRVSRIKCAKKCVEDLKQHLFLFDSHEQFLINNSLIEINNLIEKLDNINIESIYQKFEKIESSLFPLSQKVWEKQITYPLSYIEKDSFNFLIGSYPTNNYVETRLITDKHLENIDCKIKNYGFLYRVNNNIVYCSTKNFLYTKDNEGNVEIDDKSDSLLLTPKILTETNLSTKLLTGKILLKNALPCGIYVICENELSNDYIRAQEISERYELPLIKIDKTYYKFVGNNEVKQEIQEIKQPKVIKKPKMSLSEKIKRFNHKIIYDEEIEDFKKVL